MIECLNLSYLVGNGLVMQIKTLNKLQDLIYEDFIWRKKELIDLKQVIYSTNNPIYIRSGFALLCAHFEGFIKQVANYYLVYESSQNIPISELKCNFAAIYSANKLKPCKDSEKISVYNKFLSSFLSDYNSSNFKIKYSIENPIIKTGGNPSSTIFEEIIYTLGLDFSIYETKRNYIDTDLLSNRHKIVHGERFYLKKEEFNQTLKNVIDIMELFNDQVFVAAQKKYYLKT